MTLTERLLTSVSSFLLANGTNSVPTFEEDFSQLGEQVKTCLEQGSLSLKDQYIIFQVAKAVEEIAVCMENLDQQCTLSLDGLMAKVVSAVDDNDGRSRPFLVISSVALYRFLSPLRALLPSTAVRYSSVSHSTQPFQRSPTPTPPSTPIPPSLHSHSQSLHSNRHSSDNDSTSDDAPKNNKKTGPKLATDFRHLRDWFLAVRVRYLLDDRGRRGFPLFEDEQARDLLRLPRS